MSECIIELDGKDIFVIFNGERIAKRGHPGTPQARTSASAAPPPQSAPRSAR